jgi:copper chaperone NosL
MSGARLARAVLVAALLAACGRSSQPAPIAFDREPCAHCRMLISDPAYAAQLESAEGEVESFDDPGCLLAVLDAHPDPRAVWFHHVREARWLAGGEVGFVRVPHTPMGYGLGAVAADEPGALSLEEARALVAADGARTGAP